jgi:hypothetical protein
MEDVMAGFLKTARQLEVLRVELEVPGLVVEEGKCGREKLCPKY